MPKNIRVQKSSIDDAISTFGNLPSKAPFDYSLREAIRQILPAIKDLMNKGYNLDEISKLLAQKNIEIGTTTLKQYIRDFDKSQPQSYPPKQTKQSKVKIATTPVAEEGQEKSIPPTPSKNTIAAKEVAVDRAVAIEQLYKSPPKPGSDQFKNY